VTLPFYQVDAFTDKVFGGNPAAVVPLSKWLPDEILLKIAQEHNQSETAYFVPVKDGVHDYELRWYTPADEVDLCGHATLASSFVIFNYLGHKAGEIKFKTRFAGDLSVRRDGDWLELNFPVREPKPAQPPAELLAALGAPVMPVDILRTERDWYFVFANAEEVAAVKPDFAALAKRKDWQCVTAPGRDCDFVSRFFTPDAGIVEDPVTGSTHCALIPYWAKRLVKTQMIAKQISERGGLLKVGLENNRVRIAGKAILYSSGHLHL
jgi:PhzF family phenazine biosynthesis protein